MIFNKEDFTEDELILLKMAFKMLDAAMELVGDDAEAFIIEIGSKCGYASSNIPYISEVSYKRKKQELKTLLARKIHLID